jgi:hypothetical protein
MRNAKAQLAMLAACLVLCTAAFRWASKPALPELAVPNGFGVNIHFRGEPRDLDLIAAGGFKFIRMDFSWSGIERKKGVYDFEKSGYDALTAGCLKRGIRPLYILDYSNRLYESESSVRTDEGRRAFAAFAEAAAKRYRGKHILWEIWNEPNIKQFWKPEPNVDDYCKLVEAAAPLVKKADPSGILLAPATSTIPFPWLEDCFKRGLLRWVDAVSVHPYRPKPPETVIADYGRLRDLIKKHAPAGKEIPIVSGEWGYSHVNWDKSRLSDEQQAQYLAREFLVNLYQKIPVSIWYDWKNDGTNPNEREHNFGTMTNDLQPTPTYDAAKTLARALAGYAVAERLNVGSESDFVLKMRKGRRTALAAWTTSEKHDVTLKMKKGQGTLTDMLGGESALSWKADDLKLTLSQSPQYLLIK